MSWFIKYRPKQIKDLDITSVREQFLQMMKTGNIPQVMIFSGPKGTGKTSSSRIIGAMLNDPVNESIVDKVYFKKNKKKIKQGFKEPSINELNEKIFIGSSYIVQEIDAASNRGIDDIRSLKERVFLSPSIGKMSVYILDEAHMLTKEAFNALLKLLEEPPQHTIFILATTELHKIPSTVKSRAVKISFRKAADHELARSLQRVVKAEKIKASQKALDLISTYADGSFRDAVKLLQMAVLDNEVSVEDVEKLIGGNLYLQVQTLIKAVLDKDEQQVSLLINDLRLENVEEKAFNKIMFSYLHDQLLISLGVNEGNAFNSQKVIRFFLEQLLTINPELSFPIPFLALELKMLEIVFKAKKQSVGGRGESIKDKIKKEIKTEKSKEKVKKKVSKLTNVNKKEKVGNVLVSIDDSSQTINFGIDENFNDILETDSTSLVSSKVTNISENSSKLWKQMVELLTKENLTLGAVLNSAKLIDCDNNKIKIGVYYKFHLEQLQQPKFLNVINLYIQKVFRQCPKVAYCLVDKQDSINQEEDIASKAEDLLF